MKVSVHETKNAQDYRVLLDGEVVTGWIEADDTAGTVTREVADTSGGARFMRREIVRGVVVIQKPTAARDKAG